MIKITKTQPSIMIDIPSWLIWVMLIRTALSVGSFTMHQIDTTAIIKETLILLLLIVPYIASGAMIYFNKKMGVQCLMIAAVLEFLSDIVLLMFGSTLYEVFRTFAFETSLFNTPFSTVVFLYVGTQWKSLLAEETANQEATAEEYPKWYQCKGDWLVTVVVIGFTVGIYQYIPEIQKYFSAIGYPIFWIEMKFGAIVIIGEGLVVGITHFWKWIGVTAASVSLVIAVHGTVGSMAAVILVWILCTFIYGYGTSMFAVASLVYVIRKNIGRMYKHG